MSTNEFAMASEWMDNGNVNQFVKVHKDVNRFELVRFRGSKLSLLVSIVVWFSQLKGISRGLAYMHGEEMVHGDLKGVNLPTPVQLFCLLTDLSKGQHSDRPRWPRAPRRLRTHYHCLRFYNLKFIYRWWDYKMDESRAPQSGSVLFEGQSTNEGIGLLCPRDGDTRSPQRTASLQRRQ